MRLVLEVTSGPFQGKQIETKVGEVISVGRSPKANVVLVDTFMSGAHFAVECDSQGCRLRDLTSRNGTKLNGELITDAALKDGDRVHAGRTDFIVRVATAPKGSVAPEPTPSRPAPAASAAVVQKSSSRPTESTMLESPRVPSAHRSNEPAPPVKTEPRPPTPNAPAPPGDRPHHHRSSEARLRRRRQLSRRLH